MGKTGRLQAPIAFISGEGTLGWESVWVLTDGTDSRDMISMRNFCGPVGNQNTVIKFIVNHIAD